MPKTTKQTIKVNLYEIITREVDGGIMSGLRRAFKHSEAPMSEDEMSRVEGHLHTEIMLALDNVIDWGND